MAGSPRTISSLRGATIVPDNPTGRLVITSTTPNAGKNGGAQVVHWMPREGLSWVCSECGRGFARDEDRRNAPWRQVSGDGC